MRPAHHCAQLETHRYTLFLRKWTHQRRFPNESIGAAVRDYSCNESRTRKWCHEVGGLHTRPAHLSPDLRFFGFLRRLRLTPQCGSRLVAGDDDDDDDEIGTSDHSSCRHPVDSPSLQVVTHESNDHIHHASPLQYSMRKQRYWGQINSLPRHSQAQASASHTTHGSRNASRLFWQANGRGPCADSRKTEPGDVQTIFERADFFVAKWRTTLSKAFAHSVVACSYYSNT